ncbi:MAG: hypothetical protein AAF297_00710 [Planctomycetota bacterium]
MSTIARQPEPTQSTKPAGDRLAAARRRLASARVWARTLVIAEGLAWTLALLGSLLLVSILTDAALRLPVGVRWIILIIGTAIGIVATRRWIAPAFMAHAATTWLALRLERLCSPESGARGLIASGLELDRAHETDPVTRALSARAVERAAEAFTNAGGIRLIRVRPAVRAIGALAGLVVIGALLAVPNPSMAGIGLTRALAPWAGAEWPKRTDIADGTAREFHASDTALPVRAHLFRTNRDAGETRVELSYRLVTTDAAGRRTDGPVRTAVMTPQRRPATIDGREAEVFERLIDPSVFAANTASGTQRTLQYRLSTDDDATAWASVRLVNPPEIRSITATVETPGYATGAAALVMGELDLGRGDDARAIVGPVLAGSRITLRAEYTSEIELADTERAEIAAALEAADPDAAVRTEGTTLTVIASPSESARLPLRPTDQFGFSPREDTVIAIDVVPDRDPTPAIVDPPRDESVLASAVIPVRAEAGDDIGLVSLALVRTTVPASFAAQPADGAVQLPALVTVELGRVDLGSDPATPSDNAFVEATVDLSTLGLSPGDEVQLTATAADARGPGVGAVTSPARRLRIIEPTELVDQLRSRLDQVRRSAARLDQRQGELARALPDAGEGPPPESLATDQAALTERLAEQRRAVEALEDRQERNALDDESLEGLLDNANELLEAAAEASAEAAQAANAGQNERAEEEQRDVRRDLGRLLELLDRGEDSFVVRRSLERLLDDQRRLEADTARAGEATAGQSADELSQQQQSELEQLAERQRELADRAESIIDELDERGEELRQSDPGQAESLDAAAAEGREAQVGQQLQQAAEATEQNRTADASRQQQEAAEAIEEMLNRLDEAERRRDRALQRLLASIADRIRSLIEQQQDELDALTAAAEGDGADFETLADAMIAIHTRTLALVADAAAGPPETRAVADPLSEAATAQIEAIDSLRADPPLIEAALTAERVSLQRLTDALDVAEEELEDAEERERERLLDEVRAAYRAALADQRELRQRTAEFVGRDLGRRDRATVRGLGREQTELAERLAQIPEQNPQLAEVPVVALIHRRMDAVGEAAAEALRGGRAEARAEAQQRQVVEMLRSLIEHLGPPRGGQPDDGFGDGGGGGGGGGGDQGGGEDGALVELAAELKLLRDLQALAQTLTRAADDAEPGAAEPGEVADLQRSISDQAVELLSRIQQEGAPPPQPLPDDADNNEPAAEPGLEPGSEPDLEPSEEPAPDAPAEPNTQGSGGDR